MKASVIGLGRIGLENSFDNQRFQPASHVGCYKSLPDVDAIAVCDTDASKLAKALAFIDKTKKAYLNYHEMMLEFKPELVSIATPTPTHKKIVCDVAKHSCVKRIFLEKPIAQSLDEADAIIEACKNNNVKLAVNYTRRWSEPYLDVDFTKNEIGYIISMIGIHHGPLLRTGTHMLDLFNMLTMPNKPFMAQAFGHPRPNYITDNGNDFNINGIISYDGERPCEAVLISGEQKPYVLFELDMFGTGGRIRVIDNGRTVKIYDTTASDRYENLNELKLRLKQNYRNDSVLFDAIHSLVKNGQILCTGEDGKQALQSALALHYSAMNGQLPLLIKDVPKDYTVRSY